MACCWKASTSAVLPMPGSPVTKTSCRWPCRAWCRHARNVSSMPARPTRWPCAGGTGAADATAGRSWTGGDEAVPASGQRLNKPRGLRPVSKRAADLEDAAFQDLRLDVRLGPHRREECLLRHQLAGMRHEIAQHGKRLGGEQQALVVCRLPVAPETLVDGIQPEWRELLHARPSTVGMAGAAGQDGGVPRSWCSGYHFRTGQDTTKPLLDAFITERSRSDHDSTLAGTYIPCQG